MFWNFQSFFFEAVECEPSLFKIFSEYVTKLMILFLFKKFGEKNVQWQNVSVRLIFGSFVSPKLNPTETFGT